MARVSESDSTPSILKHLMKLRNCFHGNNLSEPCNLNTCQVACQRENLWDTILVLVIFSWKPYRNQALTTLGHTTQNPQSLAVRPLEKNIPVYLYRAHWFLPAHWRYFFQEIYGQTIEKFFPHCGTIDWQLIQRHIATPDSNITLKISTINRLCWMDPIITYFNL